MPGKYTVHCSGWSQHTLRILIKPHLCPVWKVTNSRIVLSLFFCYLIDTADVLGHMAGILRSPRSWHRTIAPHFPPHTAHTPCTHMTEEAKARFLAAMQHRRLSPALGSIHWSGGWSAAFVQSWKWKEKATLPAWDTNGSAGVRRASLMGKTWD